jgi:Lipocalin-like domain
MRVLCVCALVMVVTIGGVSQAQSAKKQAVEPDSAREKLIGAWHLVHIDAPGPDGNIPQPIGMLTYTRDGHVSVQLMYPKSASALSNEYVLNGYEASFGRYDLDEAQHTLTHHVQGSNTRDLLVGKGPSARLRVHRGGSPGHQVG